MRCFLCAPLLLLGLAACGLDEGGAATGADATADAPSDVTSLPDVIGADAPDDVQAPDATDASFDSPDTHTFDPSSLTGLVMWLRADRGISVDGSGNVQGWADQGPHAVPVTQPLMSARPSLTSASINGKPAVTFSAAKATALVVGVLPAMTAAHAFLVHRRTASPPPTYLSAGLWHLSGNIGNGAVVPYTDNKIYDDFGALSRHDTAVSPLLAFTTANLYEVVSSSAEWTLFENGTQLYTTSTNTVSFAAAPALLGANTTGNYYDGDWSELVIVDHKLSTGDRATLVTYFNGRYALGAN